MKVYMPEAQFITLDSLKLEYFDWGNPDKPALLWVHGGTGHPINWSNNVDYFKDRYHCLALTHRGHGNSQWADPSRYADKDFAYELALFIDAMGLNKVSLIGSSSGGRVALQYAASHPERVNKLVFTEVTTEYPAEMYYFGSQLAKHPARAEFNSWDEFYNHVKKTRNPNATDEQVRALASATAKQLPNGKIGWKHDTALEKVHFIEFTEEAKAFLLGKRPEIDYWYLLTQVKCPTLIIRGTKSPMIHKETIFKMAAIMDQAIVLELDAGHVPFWDKADEFNAAVEKFLGTGV